MDRELLIVSAQILIVSSVNDPLAPIVNVTSENMPMMHLLMLKVPMTSILNVSGQIAYAMIMLVVIARTHKSYARAEDRNRFVEFMNRTMILVMESMTKKGKMWTAVGEKT